MAGGVQGIKLVGFGFVSVHHVQLVTRCLGVCGVHLPGLFR